MSRTNQFSLIDITKTYAASEPPAILRARHGISAQTLWTWKAGLAAPRAEQLVIALRHNPQLHAALLRDLPSSSGSSF